MEPTPEEKAKASRALVWLYVLMAIGIGLPFVLFFLVR